MIPVIPDDDARQQITRLVLALDDAADGGRFAESARLLADATMTVEGTDLVVQGEAAVEDQYRRSTRLYDGSPRTLHSTTGIQVDVDDRAGTASALCSFVLYQQASGLGLAAVAAGENRYTFARSDGRWRITGRHVHVRLVGDLTHHLAENPL